MNNNLPYQLLIFDWDGTLMDSAAHITACMQNAIKEVGAEYRDDAAVRNIIGLGLDEAVQQLYPDAGVVLIQRIVTEYREEFLVRNKQVSPLFTGVRELLTDLQARGYDLAVATGKSRRGLDKVLEQSGLHRYFPITRCADETFSKPHPLMLEEILTDHDLTVDRALMIGDSEYDLLMANNIRMDAVAVSYGVHDTERLQQHKPLVCLDDLRDLSGWLENTRRNDEH